MNYFLRVDITKYHKLGGLNREMYCLTVVETRSLKPSYLQNWFFLRALREHVSPASLLASCDTGKPCSMDALLQPLPPSSHGVFLYISVSMWLSSYRDTCQIGLGAYPTRV